MSAARACLTLALALAAVVLGLYQGPVIQWLAAL